VRRECSECHQMRDVCDRCEKPVKPEWALARVTDPFGSTIAVLCPDCTNDLNVWGGWPLPVAVEK